MYLFVGDMGTCNPMIPPQEMWSRIVLSAKKDQHQTWAYAKNSFTTIELTLEQRASGQRDVLNNVVNKLCKNANLCKLLLSYGVTDARSLANILGTLVLQHAQPHEQGRAAQYATEGVRTRHTLRMRSRSRARVARRR